MVLADALTDTIAAVHTRQICRSALARSRRIGQSGVVELTKSFTAEQYAGALESWGWIGLDGKSPLLASLFGDVFLASSEGCWYLDTKEGSLQLIWSDASELNAAMNTADGQDAYLLGGLAHAAERRGMVLDANSIYDFTVAPILGGPIEVSNISTIDFVVGVNIAGQIHQQVRARAPGTRITAVSIDGNPPTKRRRLWPRSR